MQKLGWEFVRQGFEIAKEKDDEIKWVALPDQKEAGHGHGFFSANTGSFLPSSHFNFILVFIIFNYFILLY